MFDFSEVTEDVSFAELVEFPRVVFFGSTRFFRIVQTFAGSPKMIVLFVEFPNTTGGSRGAPPPPPPHTLLLFWVKKEEKTEGRRARWASKIEPSPLLSSKSGSAAEC